MNDMIYIQRICGEYDKMDERNPPPKKKLEKIRKTPVWLPSRPPSMIWRANIFPVSKRTENKADNLYVGKGTKLMGQKKCKERNR